MSRGIIFICTNCMEKNPALGKEVSNSSSKTFVVKAMVSNHPAQLPPVQTKEITHASSIQVEDSPLIAKTSNMILESLSSSLVEKTLPSTPVTEPTVETVSSIHVEESPGLKKTADIAGQESTATSLLETPPPSTAATVSSPQEEIVNRVIPEIEISSPEKETENLKTPGEGKSLGCEFCIFKCSDQNAMVAHTLEKHEIETCKEYKCNDCKRVFFEEDQLREHAKLAHSNLEYSCSKCEYKTRDEELFKTHVNYSHDAVMVENFTCEVCSIHFTSKPDLSEHAKVHSKNVNHLCDLCAHEATTEADLDQHKLSSHQTQNINASKLEEENIILKRTVRTLEENYDRIITMFQKQQNESKDKALAYRIEIEASAESFRVVKAENEKLKEVNEVQHKLWKIFVDKFEKDEASKKTPINGNTGTGDKAPNPAKVDDSPSDEEDIDLETSYEEWLRDTRSRGFKRTSPMSNSAERNGNPDQPEEARNARSSGHSDSNQVPQPRPDHVQYCHNWNNYGKCTYQGCRFLHQTAPTCKFDGDCRRTKCMFSHKKQNMNFLANKSKTTRAPMSAWGSMIPPWSSPFPFPNPWQNQSMNRRNRN